MELREISKKNLIFSNLMLKETMKAQLSADHKLNCISYTKSANLYNYQNDLYANPPKKQYNTNKTLVFPLEDTWSID